jgi:nucleoside-diphosphate-sugar epimerase
MSEHVLITGASGYVGARIAQRFLQCSDAKLTLQIRGNAEQLAAKRAVLAAMTSAITSPADLERVDFLNTDLADLDPFAAVDRSEITTILHAAAVTRFNVELQEARVANIEGTRKVIAFAERCPRLGRLGILSTVYSCGLLAGPVREEKHDRAVEFANNYEWSKYEAEALAFAAADHLPLQLIRIATLFANDGEGRVTQYNSFHNTLKLYYYGLLSLVPGRADTPVYLVTGDFVIDSIWHLLRSVDADGVYHVVHERDDNPTLGELIDLALEIYENDETYRAKRFLRPLFTDDETIEILAQEANSFGGPVTRQALQSMTPFARQLYVTKDIANTRLKAQLRDYTAPDYRAQLARTVQSLLRTKWGRVATVSAR